MWSKLSDTGQNKFFLKKPAYVSKVVKTFPELKQNKFSDKKQKDIGNEIQITDVNPCMNNMYSDQ